MNIIFKTYCRIYQQLLHASIPFLPYRTPVILNLVSEIPDILLKNSITSALLVTGPHIRARKMTAEFEQLIESTHINLAVYDKTDANPTTVNVEEAVNLYRDNSCNAIIAFGGGSPIDCAKAVAARIARPDKSLSDMKGILKIRKKTPILIAVPTTAGTGSETTLASVIVDSTTRHKYAINDFPLIPDYAVLDAQVTRTLPCELTATTGFDALTHAIEAYIGQSTTKETRFAAIEAIKLIFEYLPQAYKDGNDIIARSKMLQASYLAGCAFTKSYVGYVHAVAHSLGGKYNTAHGLANAVLLPIVLESYGASAHKKLHSLAVHTNLCTNNASYKEGAQAFIEHIKKMKKALNIPDTLECININDIPALANLAAKEGNPLYPVPKLMDAKELEVIYHVAVGNKFL